MSNSLAGAIRNAVLAHYNGEGKGSLVETIEEAIRREFDVRRRAEWTEPIYEPEYAPVTKRES